MKARRHFVDDAAQCADGDEDEGDDVGGVDDMEVDSSAEEELQDDGDMSIYRPWAAASIFGDSEDRGDAGCGEHGIPAAGMASSDCSEEDGRMQDSDGFSEVVSEDEHDGAEDIGEDVESAASFGEAINVSRLRAGHYCLALAPGVERAGSGAGARNVIDRAGIGVLAGPAAGLDYAEFRLLNQSLTDGRLTYRAVRHVEASELSGFHFVQTLDAVVLPSVPTHQCRCANDVFAAAMGLFRPQQGTSLFGVLHGGWKAVQQILDAHAHEQCRIRGGRAKGIKVSGVHGPTCWMTCKRLSPSADRVSEDV